MGMGLEALGQHAGNLDGESLQAFDWARWKEGLNEGDVEERKGNHPCHVHLPSFCSLKVGAIPVISKTISTSPQEV